MNLNFFEKLNFKYFAICDFLFYCHHELGFSVLQCNADKKEKQPVCGFRARLKSE